MEAQRKKIGLALGSGAAKGFAHLGVIEALEEYGIAIDMIAGTSIGAIFGGWYAATQDTQKIIAIVKKADLRSLISWRNISPRTASAIFNTGRLEKFLRKTLGSPRIENLPIPFAAVTVDIKTGETVELRQGDLVRAMLASMAVPAIFPPVEWGGKLLADGGLVQPIPLQACRNLGAEVVIGVGLTTDYIVESVGTAGKNIWRPWQFFNIISKAISVMENQLIALQRSPDDIILSPRVGHIFPADFSKWEEGISAGRREVKAMKKVILEKTEVEEKPKTLGEKFREFLFEE